MNSVSQKYLDWLLAAEHDFLKTYFKLLPLIFVISLFAFGLVLGVGELVSWAM